METSFVMDNFWQHPDGCNCAVTALIKVAIIEFGIGNVFHMFRVGDRYTIRLRDGRSLAVRQSDIDNINYGNFFVFTDSRSPAKRKKVKMLEDYVRLCYAAMITCLIKYQFKGRNRKLDAIAYLQLGGEEGELNTDHIYRFLGLQRVTKSIGEIEVKEVKKWRDWFSEQRAVLLYGDAHVVAASYGEYDDYGTRKKIGKRLVGLLDDGSNKLWYYQVK